MAELLTTLIPKRSIPLSIKKNVGHLAVDADKASRALRLTVDVGGTGKTPFAVNFNVASHNNLDTSKKIPRLYARIGKDSPSPFGVGTVDLIISEGTPNSFATAYNMARIIKAPGGSIYIMSPNDEHHILEHKRLTNSVKYLGGRALIHRKDIIIKAQTKTHTRTLEFADSPTAVFFSFLLFS